MKLWRRLRYWLNQRRAAADLAEEMEHHRSLLPPDEAARAMGNITRMREESRAVWIWPWLESIAQDVRYAIRNLRRQPGFTLVALLALGCGIGVNTSLFTVFNAMALRPWPVKDPNRVVNVFRKESVSSKRADLAGFSGPEYRYLAANAKTFTGMIAHRGGQMVRLDDQKSMCSWVAGNFFSVLGVQMQLGRGFMPEEDVMDSPQAVVVLRYGFWRDKFGSDPGIIGKRIRIEEILFTVVGVSAEEFTGTSPERVDVWIPLAAAPLLSPHDSWARDLLRDARNCCINVGGRLAPGVSRETAQAEIAVLSAQFRTAQKFETSEILLTATPFFNSSPRAKAQIMPKFGLMLAGVLLVLLLACANIGNLMLARAAARRREIVTRLSLGASRARLIRQLLTESLVLAMAAGALGIVLAYRLPALVMNAAINEPISFRFDPDARVVAYTVGLCVFACLAFGLAPALHGTRTASMGSRLGLRSSLLAIQVAASVILLVGAGLLVRGIQSARRQDPGFAIRDVTVASFDFPAGAYDAPRTRAFFIRLPAELGQTVGMTRTVPLASSRSFTQFRLPGETENQNRIVLFHQVSGGYFDVLRIPVLAGRNLGPGDAARNAIVINETMARRYWNGQSPVGKTIITGSPHEIVGVVKDVYTTDLDKIEPTFYQSITGNTIPSLLVPNTGSSRIAAVVARVDSRVQVHVTPLAENLERWLDPARVGAAVAAGLGMLALALASIGMFGVFSYWVQQRTQEIGIRMALGARPAQVIHTVLGGSFRPVAIGLAAGFLGSGAAARLLQRFLFGVSPLDPASYLGVAMILTAAAIVATYFPARRATRIDPINALKYE